MQYDIESLQNDLFALNREKKYAQALELLQQNAGTFPKHSIMLQYFKACMEYMTGDTDGALLSLEAIINRGGSVPGNLLEQEPDLRPIRDMKRFRDIALKNEALRKERMEQLAPRLTMPAILRDGSKYVIYYLHGNNRKGEIEKRIFSAMPSIRDTMCFPDAPERYFNLDAHIWNDEDAAYRYITEIIERHSGERKVILAGFSRGARAALKIVYERKYPVTGVIAYAPANLNDIDAWTFLSDTIKVPVEVMVGGDDPYGNCQRLCDMMREGDIPVRHTIIENTGHTYPDEYERYFTEALERIKRCDEGKKAN